MSCPRLLHALSLYELPNTLSMRRPFATDQRGGGVRVLPDELIRHKAENGGGQGSTTSVTFVSLHDSWPVRK